MNRSVRDAVLAAAALLLATMTTSAVDAEAIRLTADGAVAGVWVNGKAVALGTNAGNWAVADDYGKHAKLRLVAVEARSGQGLGRAGLIGVIVLADGRWVCTDRTWRVWSGRGEPPNDARGRGWTHPDYDDRKWPWAAELGPYGCGPWGVAGQQPTVGGRRRPAKSKLDAAMRQTAVQAKEEAKARPTRVMVPMGTSIQHMPGWHRRGSRHRWNSTWIWAERGIGAPARTFYRKAFDGACGTPPNAPQDIHLQKVSSRAFTIAWQPCFAPQGDVSYEVAWNGLVLERTKECRATITGLSINPYPQNYAWVRAVAPDGTHSAPSRYLLVRTSEKKAPSAPSHLRVLGRGRHGVTVAWDPAVDNVSVKTYRLRINQVPWILPGGVCQVRINNGRLYKPGQQLEINLTAVDRFRNAGPAAKLTTSTLAARAKPLAAPSELKLTKGNLQWTGVSGAAAYELWRDGEWVGVVKQTTVSCPKGATPGYVQVVAVDQRGNQSPKTKPLLIGKPSPPAGPSLFDAGRSGHVLVLGWSRPAAGTCVGYRVEQETEKGWKNIRQIDTPWHCY